MQVIDKDFVELTLTLTIKMYHFGISGYANTDTVQISLSDKIRPDSEASV